MTITEDQISLAIIATRLATMFPPAFFFFQSYRDKGNDDPAVRGMRRVFLSLCASLFLVTLTTFVARLIGLIGIHDNGYVLLLFIFLAIVTLALESYSMGEYLQVLRSVKKRDP